MPVGELHGQVAAIALRAAGRHGFALGGGNALMAHGVINRFTADVDLFTDEEENVAAAAEGVEAALREAGFGTERRDKGGGLDDVFYGLGDGLAEWIVTAPGGEQMMLQMAYFDRARRPVTMDVGPVLDLEDVVGGKVCALASRVEPRDYVDTAAALERYTVEQIVGFARRLDPGLTDRDSAEAAGRLDGWGDGCSPRSASAPRASPDSAPGSPPGPEPDSGRCRSGILFRGQLPFRRETLISLLLGCVLQREDSAGWSVRRQESGRRRRRGVEAPAEDLGGVDADDWSERLTVRAGRLVQSLGRAAHHDATRPPRRQHVVDRQRNLGIGLDVAELLGPGEVATADVDGLQGRVVGPAQRHDMRYPVGIDGGEPAEPWLAEIGQLGWGEGAHRVVLFWADRSSW